MKLIRQMEYKGHTLMLFRQRVPDPGERERRRHWIVVAPDGVNVAGPPLANESDARAMVDRLAGTLDQHELDDPRR